MIRARQVGTFPLIVIPSAILKRLQKLQIEYLVPSLVSRYRHNFLIPAFSLGT